MFLQYRFCWTWPAIFIIPSPALEYIVVIRNKINIVEIEINLQKTLIFRTVNLVTIATCCDHVNIAH